MTELRVIDGIQKEKPNYRELYSNAFINTLTSSIGRTEDKDLLSMDLDTRKKVILYGVKKVNATNFDIPDYELLKNEFNIISSINSIMGTLTPRELLTIFPIVKEYDGEKYGFKDYFYTKKVIEEFGMDKVIGEEMTRFHWDYHNRELTKFASQTMFIMSAIERAEAEGRKRISEVQEVMSFRDAVHNCMIEVFDDECKGVLDNSMKGKLANIEFSENASAVFGEFLTELYEENREKFIELAKPIHEEYCRMKSEDDAYWKREQLKDANLSLIVNKKLTPKR